MSGCKQLPFLTLERLDCYPKTFDVALESKCEVDIPNESGDYPLHIHAGNPEYVRKLLDAGAFVDCKNKNDMTPLHIAASKGVVESVYWLLLNGADVSKKMQRWYLSSLLRCQDRLRSCGYPYSQRTSACGSIDAEKN